MFCSLKSVSLVVTSTCSFILRVADIEVIAKGQANALCIGIDILSRLADGIVGYCLVLGRAEDVVGIKRGRQLSLQEGLLQSGIHYEVTAAIHESPVVTA